MLHFVKSCMKQNKSRKQTLQSAQNGLEIIFFLNLKIIPLVSYTTKASIPALPADNSVILHPLSIY